MIYCCGRYHTPLKTVFLSPDYKYRDRKLEILVCPTCGNLSAELTQYNIKKDRYDIFRPKKRNTSSFIQEVESGKWEEIKIKHGTKEKAGFIFGVNRELKDGKIYQYAVNFNGEKNLVKVIG